MTKLFASLPSCQFFSMSPYQYFKFVVCMWSRRYLRSSSCKVEAKERPCLLCEQNSGKDRHVCHLLSRESKNTWPKDSLKLLNLLESHKLKEEDLDIVCNAGVCSKAVRRRTQRARRQDRSRKKAPNLLTLPITNVSLKVKFIPEEILYFFDNAIHPLDNVIFRCASISLTSTFHWLTDRVNVFRLLI